MTYPSKKKNEGSKTHSKECEGSKALEEGSKALEEKRVLKGTGREKRGLKVARRGKRGLKGALKEESEGSKVRSKRKASAQRH